MNYYVHALLVNGLEGRPEAYRPSASRHRVLVEIRLYGQWALPGPVPVRAPGLAVEGYVHVDSLSFHLSTLLQRCRLSCGGQLIARPDPLTPGGRPTATLHLSAVAFTRLIITAASTCTLTFTLICPDG